MLFRTSRTPIDDSQPRRMVRICSCAIVSCIVERIALVAKGNEQVENKETLTASHDESHSENIDDGISRCQDAASSLRTAQCKPVAKTPERAVCHTETAPSVSHTLCFWSNLVASFLIFFSIFTLCARTINTAEQGSIY
jgi:hypothetical protein